MRLQLDRLGLIKNYIHVGQAVIIFLAIVLTVAIFTRNGQSDSRIGWYFGLCWLSMPILIYLAMVPMWSRAQRFSNVYAFATLDGLSAFLWLSAWASMASYVASGKGKGDNHKKSGCDNFKYGSPGRCELSTATTILGVIIMVLFLATFFFSFKTAMHYKQTGMMPGKGNDFSEQSQAAFSTNMHNEDLEEDQGLDARQGGYAHHQPYSQDEEYAPIYQNDHDDIGHMQAQQPASSLAMPQPISIYDADTSYGGAKDPSRPISPDQDLHYARDSSYRQ